MRNANRVMTESELVADSLRRILRRRSVTVCCNVPLLGRCVDLAYIAGRALVSVEFKLRDWRRAVLQARDHRLGADFAYICMPERSVSDAMMGELRRSGVGLMFYRENGRWPFKEVIAASKSTEIWPAANAAFRKYILANRGS